MFGNFGIIILKQLEGNMLKSDTSFGATGRISLKKIKIVLLLKY